MKKTRKVTSLMLAMALMLMMLAGCSSSSTNTTQTSTSNSASKTGEKSVSVGVVENIATLDTQANNNFTNLVLDNMIYDYLYDGDHKGNYTPSLATDYTVSKDGLTWTFNLRKGVKFQDGSDFTADDVVGTFQRIIDKRSTLTHAAIYWTALESVNKVDDYKVEFHLNQPYGAMLLGLSNEPILPSDLLAKYGDDFFTKGMCIGTGAWKFDKWVNGQYVSVTRNDNYWGGNKSNVDKIYVRIITEASTVVAGLSSGDIDVAPVLSPDQAPMLKGNKDLDTFNELLGAITYLGFKTDKGIFADKNARLAVSYGIDRQQIVDKVLGGGAPIASIMTPGTMGYDETLKVPKYDLALAKSYLAKTNYKGEKITLVTYNAMNQAQEIMLSITSMLQQVGFNIGVEVVEPAVINERRASGNYDIFSVNALHGGGDPYNYLNMRILSDGHKSGYKNADLNALITKQNQESDQKVRAEEIKQICKIMQDEVAPQLPLWQLQGWHSVRKTVTGVTFAPDGFFDLKHIATK